MSPLRKTPVETLDDPPRTGAAGRALDALLAELVCDDPELRRRAVLDLAHRPEALPHLIGRVGDEPDRTVREALCTHLARHDVPEVVDGLIRHLASEDAGLRTAVTQVLAQTPVETARAMPRLLADPDPDVRIMTVMVLATLRMPEVEGWLARLVREDPHPNVVSAAIGELAPLGGAGCERLLVAARERFPDDPFIGFTVSQALTALGSDRW